jgi:pimeloyl-ACP methyl ester carboxylesterase
VQSREPRLGRASAADKAAWAQVEAALARGRREARTQPMVALNECLASLKASSAELRQNPRDEEARRDYNFAVARMVEIIQVAKLDPWSRPLNVPGIYGNFVLAHRLPAGLDWNPGQYDCTPADQLAVHGRYVEQRTTREGVGAPLVVAEKKVNGRARETFAPPRLFYGVTAFVTFEGNRCLIGAADPLATETIPLEGHTVPLAADFTTALAVMLKETQPEKLELQRFFNPEKYARTAAIERLQPYDPRKKIVLVIHGLADSQATWTPMINTLRGDATIRENYQFWFYSYPSGYPYPYSAAILRRQLDEVQRRYPGHPPMVVIGHSMGGCIRRLLITDSGDQIWRNIFGQPPAQTPLSPRAREYFEEELIFRHRPEVERVIFISAPFRGSELAVNPLAMLVSGFVRAPRRIVDAGREMLLHAHVKADELKLRRRVNSVDTLSPKGLFVNAIKTVPMVHVPYHSIIGDRGRGDSPNSSDGVVPYWSSHLPGAESEKIVPSNHSAHQNPEAIAEVRRILKSHARR